MNDVKVNNEEISKKDEKQSTLCKRYASYTFENDDNGRSWLTDTCRRYVESFDLMHELCEGIMFCGTKVHPTGTGKTFYAGCIANELISKGKSVLMPEICSLIRQMNNTNPCKKDLLEEISSVSLLVIDDLGMENIIPNGYENLYEVIDTRYRSGKPLITTTHLTIEEVKERREEENIFARMIYDRVLAMCRPMEIIGENMRLKNREMGINF